MANAWALRLNNDGYATIPNGTPNYHNRTEYLFRAKVFVRDLVDDCYLIGRTDSAGSDHIQILPNGRILLRYNLSAVADFPSGTFTPFIGQYVVLEIIRNGDSHQLVINGTLIDTVTQSATRGSDATGLSIGAGGAKRANADIYQLELFADAAGTIPLFNFENDIDGSQNIFPEKVSGNNATLVDLPSDGSQWLLFDNSPVSDTTAPVIALDPPTLTYNLTVGDTFTLPTATLTDDTDATVSITPFSNNVNTATAGNYEVVYSGYQDAAGNTAVPVTVTVNVVVAAENSLPVAVATADDSTLGGNSFTLDGSASFDSDGTIASYAWTQTSGPTCTITNPSQAITTVSSPSVITSDAATFSLVVTDNDGAVSAPKSVDVVILTNAQTPVANAGADITGISSGATVTLSGLSSTDDAGIASYKWTQKSGAYSKLNNRLSPTPSFTAPRLNTRTAYAQDIYPFTPKATPTNLKTPLSLSKILDVSYLGSAKVIYADSVDTTGYSSSALGLSNDKQSFYLGTFDSVVEFEIPALSTSSVFEEIPTVAVTQPFREITSLNTAGNPVNRINGLLDFDGKLIVSREIWYNASATNADNMQFLSSSTDIANATNTGLMQYEGAAYSAGFLTKAPAEFTSALGATHISGWANVYSITGRYSQGPSLYAFNPQDVVNSSAGGTIPSIPLLNYPLSEGTELVSGGNTASLDIDPLWGISAKHRVGFLVPNTNLYIALGSHGGLNDGIGYKITQDTGNLCGGYCTYTASDYYNYFWAYNINDIVNAVNPWDVKPFAFGKWEHPFDEEGTRRILGGDFDEVNNRLYLLIEGAALAPNGSIPFPSIIAYDIQAKATENTAIGTDLTDLVFELEVTNVNGLTSTDTVTVSLDATVAPDTTPPTITIAPPQTVYNLTVGDSFTTPVGTATDAVDGVSTVTPTGTVNVNAVGTYTLTYAATDAAGNVATPVIVTVNVAETPFNGSVLSMSSEGIPNGSYATRIVNPTTSEVIFSDTVAWSSESASVSLEGIDAGTALEYYVIGAEDGSLDRGVTV